MKKDKLEKIAKLLPKCTDQEIAELMDVSRTCIRNYRDAIDRIHTGEPIQGRGIGRKLLIDYAKDHDLRNPVFCNEDEDIPNTSYEPDCDQQSDIEDEKNVAFQSNVIKRLDDISIALNTLSDNVSKLISLLM